MTSTHVNPDPPQKYWAFISYSSKDRKWGQWLHKRLESYPIPPEFQGTEIFDGATLGKNLRPIFRDRDELAGSADLGPAIAEALRQTRFLIVLCSPNSAQSQWVNKEIEDFRALQPGNDKRILALILDGEPNASSNDKVDAALECFPPALQYPHDPLAGDLRKEGDGKERGFLKILSGISQIGFDELYKRHERAQRKKRLTLGAIAATIIAALTGLSIFAFQQKNEADQQKEIAIDANNKNVALLETASINEWATASGLYEEEELDAALARCANGLKSNPGNLGLVHFSISLLEARKANPLRYTLALDHPLAYARFAETPGQIITVENFLSQHFLIKLWDFKTYNILDQTTVPITKEFLQPTLKIPASARSSHPWLNVIPEEIGSPQYINSEKPFQFRHQDHIYTVKPDALSFHPTDNEYLSHRVPLPLNGKQLVSAAASPDKNHILLAFGAHGIGESDSGIVFLFGEEDRDSFYFQETDDVTAPPLATSSKFVRASDRALESLSLPTPSPSGMAMLNDTQLIVISSFEKFNEGSGEVKERDGTIRLFDLASKKLIAEVPKITMAHWNEYTLAIAKHPTKDLYAIQGDDALRVWDITTNQIRSTSEVYNQGAGWTGSVAFSSDGETIYSGLGRAIHFTSTSSLEPVREPIPTPSIVSSISVHAEQKRIVTGYGHGDGAGSGGYAQVWDSETFTRIGPGITLSDQIELTGFLGKGEAFYLSSMSPEGSDIQIWDSATSLPRSCVLTYDATKHLQVFMTFSHYHAGETSTIYAGEPPEIWLRKPLSTPGNIPPDWFHHLFLPFVASRDIDPTGRIRVLTADDLGDYRTQLLPILDEDDSIYAQVARQHLGYGER